MKKIIIYIVFVVVGFLLTLPAFAKGLIPTDDIFVYSNWHQCFSAQLRFGEWYPRWLMDMNGGHGSPVFFFYPPLPFYVSALMELLLPTDSPGWFPIYLSYGLALGLSGVTSFLFLRCYANTKCAFWLALFYMFAPYHLFVNFYHRFAYPEFWAFTWAPLLFYFLVKCWEGNKRFYISLSLTYSLLLLSHLPSLIILTPVLAVYIVAFAGDKRRIISSFLSLFVSIGITAFYVLPMLLYQPFISLDKMWEGKYALKNNFLLGSAGFNDFFLLKITLVNLFVLLLLCFALKRPGLKRDIFWLGIGFFSILLMFEVSVSFWEWFPLVKKIQFPWRLNLLTLLAIVTVAASAMRKIRHVTILAGVVLCAQVVAIFMQILPVQKGVMTEGQMAVVKYETETKLGVVEYLPGGVSKKVFQDMQYRRLDKMDEQYVLTEGGALSLLQWSPREIEFQASSVNGFDVLVRQFYFPYWQATINNDQHPLELSSGKDGLINLTVPPGQHKIKLRLVAGVAEIAGKWISLITLAAIMCFLVRGRRRCIA